MVISVGTKAPKFTLVSDKGEEVQLENFEGNKRVVLAFFPLAFTGG